MNQSTVLDTSANEPGNEGVEVAELKRGIAQYLLEIDQMREQMSRDQVEIDRSRKRTHTLLAELKAALSLAGQKAA